jgi:hypothetical protein
VLANNESWSAPMDETYELLGVDPASITSLEQYLQVGCGCCLVACNIFVVVGGMGSGLEQYYCR